MNTKKSIGRTAVDHPSRVPSCMIREELRNLQILGPRHAPEPDVAKFLESDRTLGDLYEKHPVTVQGLAEGFGREHIVPISVYFDGVQYSKNENFLGFYITNLRTKQPRLVWLLSALK